MAKKRKEGFYHSRAVDRKIIVRATKHLTVEFWSTTGMFFLRWQGHINGEIVKSEGEAIPNLLKKYGVSRVLNDSSSVIGRWDSISEWVVEYWFPQMFDAGLKYFAWVLPQEYFALISARDAMPDQPQFVKAFGDKKSAYAWLWRTTLSIRLEEKVLKRAAVNRVSPEFQKEFAYHLLIANNSAKTLRTKMPASMPLSVSENKVAIKNRLLLKAMCEAMQLVHVAFTDKHGRKLTAQMRKIEIELARLGVPGKRPGSAVKKEAFNIFMQVFDDYKDFRRPPFER